MASKRKQVRRFDGDVIVICEGLDALKKEHKNKLKLDGLKVVDSADIDNCYKKSEPNEARWDYYIGLLKQGAIYVEVHEVSYDHLDKIFEKAAWLRKKIVEHVWPEVDGRPLLIAPTAGIPHAVAQDLHRRLAQEKIIVVMKGDLISEVLDVPEVD